MVAVLLGLFLARVMLNPWMKKAGFIQATGMFTPVVENPVLEDGIGLIPKRVLYNITHPIILLATLFVCVFVYLKIQPRIPPERQYLLTLSTLFVYAILLVWSVWAIVVPVFAL